MLARSAGLKQRRKNSQILATNFAQLNLPWLAPAQLRWNASRASSRATATLRVRPSRSLTSPLCRRSLATATDTYVSPFEGNFLLPGLAGGHQQLSKELDRSRLLGKGPQSIHDFQELRNHGSPLINLGRNAILSPNPILTIQAGISGTLEELLQHLHISVRIGRTARAESIVLRLVEQTSPSAPEVMYAHTLFLEIMLRKIEGYGQDTQQAKAVYAEMQRWFEVSIRGQGTQPSEKMFVLMMKASINALPRSRRDRGIRRYADLAKAISPDLFDSVIRSEELDDEEFVIVGHATSEPTNIDQLNSSLPVDKELAVSPPSPSVTLSETANHSPVAARTLKEQTAKELPTARAVTQRGRGLTSIKYVLDEFAKITPAPADAPDSVKHEKALARQKILEESAVEAAIKSWQQSSEELRKIGIHTAMQTKPLAALMWQWQEALVSLLKKELVEVKKALDTVAVQDVDRRVYGPYMELLSTDKLAAVTIIHVLSMFSSIKSSSGSSSWDTFLKVGMLTTNLSEAVQQEAAAELSKQRMGRKKLSPNEHKRLRWKINKQMRLKTETTDVDPAHSRQLLMADNAASEWPKDVIVKLGALLLSKLTEAAQLPVTRKHPRTGEMITQMQPAFLYRVKYMLGKKVGIMTPNPALQEKLKSEPFGGAIAKRMPMVVEPRPWTGWTDGGYLHYPSAIARMTGDDGTGRQYFMAALKKGDLDRVLEGLNALGKVAWTVDQDVLRIQLEAWNSGEAIANFAPHRPHFDLPPEPEASLDGAARRRWLREVAEIENKRGGLHSQRCFQNFQLEIARAMANETLYFPHNIDFRGRAYPIPPYLNHMGADNVRGLLLFAKGKPLGEGGLRWLKIHLATVAGFDKASLDERVDFTTKHLEDIYDSVRRPLDGRRWWLKAEDAWQTLAACFELTKALDSPDPTTFVSHLPIHQDGTCNGLQHYAALGGDEAGAKQVNLEPGDRPADVYTAVADAVREEVRRDAENGNPVAQKLHGRITRKCVKQPVMTNVYGVTFYGAKAQVRKQLEVLFPEVGIYDAVNLDQMSVYIATKIFQCLGDMFRGAQAIQEWLGVCAGRISSYLTPEQIKHIISDESTPIELGLKKRGRKKATEIKNSEGNVEAAEDDTSYHKRSIIKGNKALFKSTVVWTTPLGIPVAQPYREQKTRSISTNLQSISINEPQMWHPISRRKQLQAFPPNFIHSLDATHMLLSAVKCTEIGLSFASVHDSFWTHASDVDTLSSVLRDAFVKIHSDDVVARLREELIARYKGGMYLASLKVSFATAQAVLNHRKQMSRSSRSELSQEVERMRLLNSTIAGEREKGAAMITPSSIAITETDTSEMSISSDLGPERLGTIPQSMDIKADAHINDIGLEATNSDADVGSDFDTDVDAPSDEITGDGFDASTDRGSRDDLEQQKHDAHKAEPEVDLGSRHVQIWLPMEFPEVPAKGAFDVTRLRLSKYFFH